MIHAPTISARLGAALLVLALVGCEAASTATATDSSDDAALDWAGLDPDAADPDATPADGFPDGLPDGWCAQGGCADAEVSGLVAGPCQRLIEDRAACDCHVEDLPPGSTCDDGDPCTVEDTCSAEGACEGYARAGLCDDGNPCTDDACTPGVGCAFAPNAAPCDDDSPCTDGDHCAGGACTVWSPSSACAPCDPAHDTCEADHGDANPCNGELVCQGATCVVDPTTRVVCPALEGAPCWANVCQPATGACVAQPATAGKVCIDGNPCTRDETCADGACHGDALGTLPGCACTTNDECLPLDDANACNGALRCVDGTCRVAASSVPAPCDPVENTACRANTCDPATGTCALTERPEGASCAADDLCAGPGTCHAGQCEGGAPRDCSGVATPCATGACDAASGLCVRHPANEGQACETDDPCAVTSACAAGLCATTTTIGCDDDDACTADACDSATGECTHALAPLDAPELCNDLDDDCDGQVDAADADLGLDDAPLCDVQLGVCAGATRPASACVQGTWTACPPTAYAAHDPAFEAGAETLCDGRDNDCDGQADEQLTTVTATCGTGACRVVTTGQCVGGQIISSCVPGTPLALTDTTCNGIDDDCDGQTDEEVAKTATTCGEGPCASTGVMSCVNGAPVDSCVPKPPTDEACDNLDNDCDGQTDEADDGPCLPGLDCRKGQCLPQDMELVPAGQYWRGCNATLDDDCFSNEKPAYLVYLDAYLIDRTEVTASRYKACMTGGGCTAPADASFEPTTKPNHPVAGITWQQANAFCAWMGRRLPTEAEWEKAARGGCELTTACATQAAVYPWGNDAPTCALAHFNDCTSTGGTTPAGTHLDGASPYGVLDLAGNAAEWVSDYYVDLYDDTDTMNPKGPEIGNYRVIRGGNAGSTNGSPAKLRASYRTDDVADATWGGAQKGALGFRCALFLADM